MTRATPSPESRVTSKRRRAERVQPGPIRVRLHRLCEGLLVDISEFGALVRLPSAPAVNKQVSLRLESPSETLLLDARVVWSKPHQLQLPAATLARHHYHVAVEFNGLPEPTKAALRDLIAAV